MNKTLIIYDNTGYIYLQMTGSYRAPEGGLNYLEVDSTIHENKIIKSVNVETKELVLEDIPKTELQLAQEAIETLQNYILEKESDSTITSL